MVKKPSKSKKMKKLQAFNRSQEIYKLLEKGIIVNEALSSSTGDRPEEDAHVSDLLDLTTPSKPQKQAKARPSKGRRR